MSPSAIETTPVSVGNKKHRSGDPDLSFPHDVEALPPRFEDKYEERKFLKHRLALAYRVFAMNGFADGVAGHITVRDPVEPTSFWVNPFGKRSASFMWQVMTNRGAKRPALLAHNRRRPHSC